MYFGVQPIDELGPLLSELLFRTLVRRDRSGRLVPGLARGWFPPPVPDRWIFPMASGVDVERCAWYLSLLSSEDGPLRLSSRSFEHFGSVASWRALSEGSLEVRLRLSTFDFPHFLTTPWWCVHTPDFSDAASGPYRVASLLPGRAPDEAFYLLSPAARGRDSDPLLEFTFNDSPDDRARAFLAGEADVLVGVAGADPSTLRSLADSGAHLVSSTCDVLPVAAARADAFPGDSPEVMRALKSLVEPKALAASVYGSHARPAWHSVVPSAVGEGAWAQRSLSPSAAKSILRQAVSRSGASLRFAYALPSHRRLAHALARHWERVADVPIPVERLALPGGALHEHPFRLVPMTLRLDPRTLFRVLFDPGWSDLVWSAPPALVHALRSVLLASDSRTYAAALSHLCVLFAFHAPCVIPVVPDRLDVVARRAMRFAHLLPPPGSLFSPRAFLSALGVTFPT